MPNQISNPEPAVTRNPNSNALRGLFIHEGPLADTNGVWTDLGNVFSAVPFPQMVQYGYGNGAFEFRTVQGYYRQDTGLWKTLQENDAVEVAANTVHSGDEPANLVRVGCVFSKCQYKTDDAVAAAVIVVNGAMS